MRLQVYGLDHLNGMIVTGLADGNVITPRTVTNSQITLDAQASKITIGLGFTAQLQTTYLDAGQPTIQGQRKKVAAVTVRMENSIGVKVGSNQPDGSTFSPMRVDGGWSNLSPLPSGASTPYKALAPNMYTGDSRAPVFGGFARPGQVALQQDQPLPMQILAVIAELDPGDLPQPPGPVARQRQRG